jgi:osmoprotectant transport system ATP-binding protein
VSHRYGEVRALDRVSLEVERGECVALLGESGSGKTTLLRCFNRMVEPTSGQVELLGSDVGDLDPASLRRRIGYVPQHGGLLPHWRVLRNAAVVPRLRRMDDAAQRARRWLAAVDLDPEVYGGRWPRELSGGQRQRVAVARALAADPEVVLLDEPFSAVDAVTRTRLHEVFSRLRREIEMTALLVTHDVGEAFRLADRVAVMGGGRVLQVASPEELASRPAHPWVERLIATYGGPP